MNDPPQTVSADASPWARASGSRQHLDWLWLAVCWVPYALLTRKFYFLCDDAFISFRYASNWAAGHGLRFNPGEHLPVEGYSNFLWVCLATLGELAAFDPRIFMPVDSFLAGTLLLLTVFFTLRRDFGFPLTVVAPASLFLACSPSFAVWSTSGLETAPFALLIFLTCRQLILRRGGPAGLTAGVAGLALALIRAEGIEWALLIGLLALAVQLGRPKQYFKPLGVFFAILLVGYALYFACRFAYYRVPFPNTAYVKVDPSVATLARGWDYVLVMYLTLLAPIIALLGWPLAWPAQRRRTMAPVALLAVAFPAYALVVGGDFMTMGRLLVPAWPFHAILLALLLGVIQAPRTLRRASAWGVGLLVIVLGLLPAGDRHLVPESVRARHHFRLNTDSYRSEYAQWAFMANKSEEVTELGRALKAIAQPRDSIVADVIGALAYYSDLFILFYNLFLMEREMVLIILFMFRHHLNGLIGMK